MVSDLELGGAVFLGVMLILLMLYILYSIHEPCTNDRVELSGYQQLPEPSVSYSTTDLVIVGEPIAEDMFVEEVIV